MAGVGRKPHPVDGSVLEVLGREVAFDDCEKFDPSCLGQEAGELWIVIQLAALSERPSVVHCEMEEIPRDCSGLHVEVVEDFVDQSAEMQC